MTVANFIPEVWHAQILVNFTEKSTLSNTVAREYEGTASKGNTVNVTEFAQPSIVDYATGNDGAARTIAPEELTTTSQTIAIDNEKAFAFYVDDIDKRQAAGTMNPVTNDAVAGLREDAEEFIASAMLSQGTDRSGSSALSTGNEAYDFVLDLRTELSSSTVKAPQDGRFLAVNPEFAALLLGADSKLSEVDTSGSPEGLRNAVIGRLLGFTVVESAHLSPGTPACVAYHKSAVGFVNQLESVEALRAPNKFADIVRGLEVYGGRVLRPEACLYYAEPAV